MTYTYKVKTPLWTTDDQRYKLGYIDESKDEWVTTLEVGWPPYLCRMRHRLTAWYRARLLPPC